MRKLIKKVESAFDTHTTGYSGRKLSAFWVICLITVAHLVWFQHAVRKDDFTLLLEILCADYSFAAVCLGLTTYQAVKKNKLASDTIIGTEEDKSIPDGK